MTDPKILAKLERLRRSLAEAADGQSRKYLREAYVDELMEVDGHLVADSRRLAECERKLGEVKAKLLKMIPKYVAQEPQGNLVYTVGGSDCAELLKLLNQPTVNP